MESNISNPKLLVFFLGSFLEQRQALSSNLYTELELQEIWEGMTKMPLGIDQSKVKGFQVHSVLLKQPELNSEIVLELFEIYRTSQTSLISEVLRHRNCPPVEVEQYFKSALQSDNWTSVLWSISTENDNLKKQLIQELTGDVGRIERLKFHLHNNFATNSMKDIVSICLQSSPSKRFVQDVYFYLNQNNQCLANNISDVLLNRSATGLKVLKNIWSQQIKRLTSGQKAGLLTHPNTDDKLLTEIFKTLMLDVTRDVSLFNATLWVLRNRTIPEEILQSIYLQSLPHLELLSLVIKHSTFKPDWAWWTLKDPQYDSLPPLNRELLKTGLKII